MFLFGHIGISTRIIHKLQPKADLRLIALLSILPDIVDKPIGLAFSQHFGRNTRLFGHTLLFLTAFSLFLWFQKGSKKKASVHFWPYILALLSHDLLDKIWDAHLACFLWPALGPFPTFEKEIAARWLENILKPYNLGGELLGLFFIWQLTRQYGLARKTRLKNFFNSGELEPASQTRAKPRGR